MKYKKNSFLKVTLILVVCNLIAKFLGAIYRIPLLNILGSDGLGEYQMVFSIFALFLVVSSSGIVVAISKIISREVNYNNNKNQKRYLKMGIKITIIISIILSIILLLFAPLIAQMQGSSDLRTSYLIILPSILFSSLISVFRGYFLGKKQMSLAGGIQILESIFKLVLSLFFSSKFSKFGFAVEGAILGITITEVLSFFISLIIFIFSKKRERGLSSLVYISGYKKSKKRISQIFISKTRYKTNRQCFIEIFKLTFFVTLQALAMPLIGAIDSVVIVPLLLKTGISNDIAYSLFGLEDGIVASLIALPTFISSSVGSAIIPSVKSDNLKNKQTVENIKNSIQIVWLFSIFCAFVFLFFSSDITTFLYGNGLVSEQFNELGVASDMLKIGGFNIIYLSLLILSTSILQAIDRSKVPVKNILIATLFRYLVFLLLLNNSELNIYSLILSNMIFYSLALLLNLREIKANINFYFQFKKIFIFPIIASMFMLSSMFAIRYALSFCLSTRFVTMIVMMIGGAIYLLMLAISKVINLKEVTQVFLKNRKQH